MLRCARNDAERNNIAFKGWDVVRQYALKFFKTAESSVDKVVSSCEKNPSVHGRYMNFLRQRKTALDAPLYAVSAGRSMIEMLGVLAIIAVLKVGGIAGYSKAMQKYKINKMLDDYTMLITNILEHLDEFEHVSKNSSQIGLVDVLQASGIIPPSWKKMNSLQIWDSNGNLLSFYSSFSSFYFIINIGGHSVDSQGTEIAGGFSQDICLTLFKDLIKPLHYPITSIMIYGKKGYFLAFGDAFCDDYIKKCLSNLTLSEMKQACEICNDNTYCEMNLRFFSTVSR